MFAKIALLLVIACAAVMASDPSPTLGFTSESKDTGKQIQQAQQIVGDLANQVGEAGKATNGQVLNNTNTTKKQAGEASAKSSASSDAKAKSS